MGVRQHCGLRRARAWGGGRGTALWPRRHRGDPSPVARGSHPRARTARSAATTHATAPEPRSTRPARGALGTEHAKDGLADPPDIIPRQMPLLHRRKLDTEEGVGVSDRLLERARISRSSQPR